MNPRKIFDNNNTNDADSVSICTCVSTDVSAIDYLVPQRVRIVLNSQYDIWRHNNGAEFWATRNLSSQVSITTKRAATEVMSETEHVSKNYYSFNFRNEILEDINEREDFAGLTVQIFWKVPSAATRERVKKKSALEPKDFEQFADAVRCCGYSQQPAAAIG
ncbi:MAG: hypothetical protein J3R72DRAFT_428287 [Linnemannia gamsii]|nr:MAG: hypothetical protein J3R72DRAFT_428287 [Linnemannia gamsii]